MNKPVFIVWSLAWTVFAGVLITVALLVPGAQVHLGRWILGGVVLAGVLAVPLSVSVSKALVA